MDFFFFFWPSAREDSEIGTGIEFEVEAVRAKLLGSGNMRAWQR